jgi:hypothetical protein
MAMVCGLDLHRRQITFDTLKVELGFPPFRGGLLIADGASHSLAPWFHWGASRAAEAI